jgi:hypothetical protein
MDDEALVRRNDVEIACRHFGSNEAFFGHMSIGSLRHMPEILLTQNVNLALSFGTDSHLEILSRSRRAGGEWSGRLFPTGL